MKENSYNIKEAILLLQKKQTKEAIPLMFIYFRELYFEHVKITRMYESRAKAFESRRIEEWNNNHAEDIFSDYRTKALLEETMTSIEHNEIKYISVEGKNIAKKLLRKYKHCKLFHMQYKRIAN